jgi:hypothetical protein
MPITSIIVVGAISLAIIVFAAVLAWGDYQTRHISRSSQQPAGTKPQISPQQSAKTIAPRVEVHDAAA